MVREQTRSAQTARGQMTGGVVLVALAWVACGRIELGSQKLGAPGDVADASGPPLAGPALPPATEPASGGIDPPVGTAPHESALDTSVNPALGADASALDAGGAAPVDPTPPSCRGETEFCGRESDSCCLSLPVAGGTLSLPIDSADTRVQVAVSSFRLDKYEVTVGRFRAFLAGYDEWTQSGAPLPEPDVIPVTSDAGSGPGSASNAATSTAEPLAASAAELERRVRECNDIPLSTLDLPNISSRIPVNCVTWLEAAAFCAWDGARLPTNAEWYHAAAGGALGRRYPWGDEPTPSRLYASYGCTLGVERPECTAAYVLPVGSHPSGAGLFGQEDLAGSMSEWLLDGSLDHYVDGCVDCAGPPHPGFRIWRSGSWIDQPTLLENDYFVIAEQKLRLPFLGLRCARDAP